jgi:hypothetical protein
MLASALLYIIGLGLSLSKVYFDVQVVGFFTYNIIVPLLADLTCFVVILFGLLKKLLMISSYLAILNVLFLDVIMALNGKGSSLLACNATGWCDTSVSITCDGTLSEHNWTGVAYLTGCGIKIMAATFIAREVYVIYKKSKPETKVQPEQENREKNNEKE